MNTKYKIFITATFLISVFFLAKYVWITWPRYVVIEVIKDRFNAKSLYDDSVIEKFCARVNVDVGYIMPEMRNVGVCYTKEKVRIN